MSSHSRITDEEMKYFQFKAKQCLLIQKEDHEWNEFCKSNKCTCCSCQSPSIPQLLREVGTQVSQKMPAHFSRSTENKSIQNKDLSESVKDIKTMLEKIDVSLSEIKHTPSKNVQLNESISPENKLIENNSVLHFLTEQKKNLIKKSLMKSLQRLHSFANRSSQPLSSSFIKSSNRSFFLPHDLQRQRVIARNAYLASLVDKPKLVKETRPLGAKKSKVSFESKHNSQITASKQRRKKSVHPINPKEPETLIQTEATSDTKDENVEKIVNSIVDDLLGDEILAFSRIKEKKSEMQLSKAKQVVQMDNRKKEVSLSKALDEARTVIKQTPFFDLKAEERKVPSNNLEDFEDVKTDIKSSDKVDTPQNMTNPGILNTQDLRFDEEKSKMKDQLTPRNYHILTVDPELVKNVTRQRKLFWQYLNTISRSKTYNFDPCALSNMIAESLLDDCIIDVCKELGDVPSSLIKDLVNQEFISTL